jgi:DNA-directed RNA polymerase subunit M/transcription elongation factor TFIIS
MTAPECPTCPSLMCPSEEGFWVCFPCGRLEPMSAKEKQIFKGER